MRGFRRTRLRSRVSRRLRARLRARGPRSRERGQSLRTRGRRSVSEGLREGGTSGTRNCNVSGNRDFRDARIQEDFLVCRQVVGDNYARLMAMNGNRNFDFSMEAKRGRADWKAGHKTGIRADATQ